MEGETGVKLRAEGARVVLGRPSGSGDLGTKEVEVQPGEHRVYIWPLKGRVTLKYGEGPDEEHKSMEVVPLPEPEVKVGLPSPPYVFSSQWVEGESPEWGQQLSHPYTLTVSLSFSEPISGVLVPVTMSVVGDVITGTQGMSGTMPVGVEPEQVLWEGDTKVITVTLKPLEGGGAGYEDVWLQVKVGGEERQKEKVVVVHRMREGQSGNALYEKRGDGEPAIKRSKGGFPGWVAERGDREWRLWLVEIWATDNNNNNTGVPCDIERDGKVVKVVLGKKEEEGETNRWCFVGTGQKARQIAVTQSPALPCLAWTSDSDVCVVALWDKK